MKLDLMYPNIAKLLASRKPSDKWGMATGVFDLLHEEHVNFLSQARALAQVFIVGVESDFRVRQLKGQNRPIWDQTRRVSELMKRDLANEVFVLPEKFSSPADHEALIAFIRPNFLAVSEHSPNLEQKQKILAKYSGEVLVVYPYKKGVSTTDILAGNKNHKQG